MKKKLFTFHGETACSTEEFFGISTQRAKSIMRDIGIFLQKKVELGSVRQSDLLCFIEHMNDKTPEEVCFAFFFAGSVFNEMYATHTFSNLTETVPKKKDSA